MNLKKSAKKNLDLKEKGTNSYRKIHTLNVSFLDEDLAALAADHANVILRNQLAIPELLNDGIKV